MEHSSLEGQVLKLLDEVQRRKPGHVGNDEWTYIALVAPLIRLARKDKLLTHSRFTSKPVGGLDPEQKEVSRAVLQTAKDCWSSTERPDVDAFAWAVPAECMPPSEKHLVCQRAAALYLQRLINDLHSFCVEESLALPPMVVQGLQLLCRACAVRDSIPRLVLVNYAAQEGSSEGTKPPEVTIWGTEPSQAWTSLTEALKQQINENPWAALKAAEDREVGNDLLEHAKDEEIMRCVLLWTMLYSTSDLDWCRHLAKQSLAMLAAFVDGNSRLSQNNARLLFICGRDKMIKMFPHQTSGKDTAIQAAFLNLLLQRLSEIEDTSLFKECAECIIGIAAHRPAIIYCLRFTFTPSSTRVARQEYQESVDLLIKLAEDFKTFGDITEALQVLLHTWCNVLPVSEGTTTVMALKLMTLAGVFLRTEWRKGSDICAFGVDVQMVTTLARAEAEDSNAGSSAFEEKVWLIHSLLATFMESHPRADRNQHWIGFQAPAYCRAYVLLLHLYYKMLQDPRMEFLLREPISEALAQNVTAELAACWESLHAFLETKQDPCSLMWMFVCNEKRTLDARWLMLENIVAVAEDLVHPEQQLSSRMDKRRLEIMVDMRRSLQPFVATFLAKRMVGRPMKAWVPLSDFIKPINLLARVMSSIYHPQHKAVLPATDKEQDALLTFLQPWVLLEAPDQAASETLINVEISLFSNMRRLSTAVFALTCGRVAGGSPKSVARKTPTTAAAALTCLKGGQIVEKFIAERTALAAKSDALRMAVNLGKQAALKLACTASIILLQNVENVEESCCHWMEVVPVFRFLKICLQLDSQSETDQMLVDLTYITDFAASNKDGIMKCQKLVPARLWMLLTCLYPLSLDWDQFAEDMTTTPVFLKSLLEAHIGLCEATPDPKWWKDKCRQSWLAVQQAKQKLKLSRVMVTRIDTLLQTLDGVGKQPAAQQVPSHEKAMQELLEAEAKEQQEAAKKARKKQSKQAARKKKAEAAKAMAVEPSGPSPIKPSGAAEPSASSASRSTTGAAAASRTEIKSGLSPTAGSLGLQDAAAAAQPADVRASRPKRKKAQRSSSDRSMESRLQEPPSEAGRDGRLLEATGDVSVSAAASAASRAAGRKDGGEVSSSVASRSRVRADSVYQNASSAAPPMPESDSAVAGPPTSSASPESGTVGISESAMADTEANDSKQRASRNQVAAASSSAVNVQSSADMLAQLEEFYTCPITHEVLKDPVAASDGFTYERAAIEAWVRKTGNSPMTGAPLLLQDLHPNLLVRQMIAALLQQ